MRKKMTRQERSSDILDDIQGKMGLNSQGKNIYLQLHLNFHLTVAAAAAAADVQAQTLFICSRLIIQTNANKEETYWEYI